MCVEGGGAISHFRPTLPLSLDTHSQCIDQPTDRPTACTPRIVKIDTSQMAYCAISVGNFIQIFRMSLCVLRFVEHHIACCLLAVSLFRRSYIYIHAVWVCGFGFQRVHRAYLDRMRYPWHTNAFWPFILCSIHSRIPIAKCIHLLRQKRTLDRQLDRQIVAANI